MFENYWIPLLASNLIALLFLFITFKSTRLARLLFLLLFGWACWLNFITAQNNPEDYLNYADVVPFEFIKNFILGWFAGNVKTIVTTISIYQGLIALGMILNKWWVMAASIGAIVFLLSITPLGIGAGFPSSVIAAVAAFLILIRDRLDFLWISSKS